MRQTIVHALSLMLGAIAVFSSCSNETDLYNPTAADQVQHKQFKEAFEKTFGKVAPTVDWGFSDTESSTLTRARTVADRETISNEDICKLGAADIQTLPEATKRAYLKQLVEESQDPVNIGTAFDIYELAAFGFKRIICEDLYVSNDCDFDYNDAVFDAKRMEEAGSSDYATFYVILRAEGAHKRIEVGQAQGKFEVHAAFNVSQQVFVNTVKKDRDIHTGAYWHKDKNPVVKIIKVAKKANGDEPTLIDIPVVVEGNSLPLRAERGEPAEKMCVDLDYSWVEEREHMGDWYPQFSHYVSGTANTDNDDTFTDENAWWRDTEENLEWWEKLVSVSPTPTPDPNPTPNPDDTTDPNDNNQSSENTNPEETRIPDVKYTEHYTMSISNTQFGVEVDELYVKDGYYNVIFKSAPTKVTKNAFYGCAELKTMVMPCITIEDYAFKGCSGLFSMEMSSPGDLTKPVTIGEEAFSGCTYLKNFAFSSNVTEIGKKTFFNCRSLEYVQIPSNVTTIGDSAYEGCTGMNRIQIGSGVTVIGWDAFKNCTSLEYVEILNPNTQIHTSANQVAFANCNNLKTIRVPRGSKSRFAEMLPYIDSSKIVEM